MRAAQKPIVNEAKAVELRKTMVEGEQFIVSKYCLSHQSPHRGKDCFMCGHVIKRRDQRCR